MKSEKMEIKTPTQKKAYQKPALKKFGKVSELTLQFGSGNGNPPLPPPCVEC
jgi:hypothetical protein